MRASPSPQRRLGPQRVKGAVVFTPWDPSLRWGDGESRVKGAVVFNRWDASLRWGDGKAG